jgi:hypothetical protein
MVEKPKQGEILGVPYNFERPSIGRLLSSYWQPGDGMLVKKPFGIGYTLNLASWRSWIVLAVVGALLWQEKGAGSADDDADAESDNDEDPAEIIVD